ncbi:hypothetical protein RA20_12745 [Leisingera sp. ANG-Vp]|nr:hypothetical protein RA20_12745 [Leisingera sp. ANG-Vp]
MISNGVAYSQSPILIINLKQAAINEITAGAGAPLIAAVVANPRGGCKSKLARVWQLQPPWPLPRTQARGAWACRMPVVSPLR